MKTLQGNGLLGVLNARFAKNMHRHPASAWADPGQARRPSESVEGLLLPYLAWACFASALTWTVWQRKPNLL